MGLALGASALGLGNPEGVAGPLRSSTHVYTQYADLLSGKGPIISSSHDLETVLTARGFMVPSLLRSPHHDPGAERILALAILAELILHPHASNHQNKLMELTVDLNARWSNESGGQKDFSTQSWLPFNLPTAWEALRLVLRQQRKLGIAPSNRVESLTQKTTQELLKERDRAGLQGEFSLLFREINELYTVFEFASRFNAQAFDTSLAGRSLAGATLRDAFVQLIKVRALRVEKLLRNLSWPVGYDWRDRVREPVFGRLNMIDERAVLVSEVTNSDSWLISLSRLGSTIRINPLEFEVDSIHVYDGLIPDLVPSQFTCSMVF